MDMKAQKYSRTMMKKDGAYRNVLRAAVSFIRGQYWTRGQEVNVICTRVRQEIAKTLQSSSFVRKEKSMSTSALAHKLSVPQLMA